jgi:hypothetical protein
VELAVIHQVSASLSWLVHSSGSVAGQRADRAVVVCAYASGPNANLSRRQKSAQLKNSKRNRMNHLLRQFLPSQKSRKAKIKSI